MATNCSCKICKDVILLNFNESVYTMVDDTVRPGSLRAKALIDKFLYWLKFVFNLIFYIGPFFLGIIVGIGLVLKDPNYKKDKQDLDWKLQTYEKKLKDFEIESKKIDAIKPKTSFTLK